jgi:hypothetical protein
MNESAGKVKVDENAKICVHYQHAFYPTENCYFAAKSSLTVGQNAEFMPWSSRMEKESKIYLWGAGSFIQDTVLYIGEGASLRCNHHSGLSEKTTVTMGKRSELEVDFVHFDPRKDGNKLQLDDYAKLKIGNSHGPVEIRNVLVINELGWVHAQSRSSLVIIAGIGFHINYLVVNVSAGSNCILRLQDGISYGKRGNPLALKDGDFGEDYFCHKGKGSTATAKKAELNVGSGQKETKSKGMFNAGIAVTVITVLYLIGLVAFVMYRKNVF